MEIIKSISIIFISIFLESLPFLLLGSIISAIIQKYISTETIIKLIPQNKILGGFIGVILGFFIPACDCAVIPVTKRLVEKKAPTNVAITFMLASPIVNPIVILATYNAFYKTNPSILYTRILLGISISIIIGIIMSIIFKNKEVIKINNLSCSSGHCSCHHKQEHKNKFINIFQNTGYDFYTVLKYLIIGALIASIIQVTVPKSILLLFNNNIFISTIVLMIFAYLLSLCSTADSFIAKSFLNIFPQTSVIAYLLLGPMIDIKNTIVLLGNFNKKFVLTLIILIFIIVFITSILVVKLIWKNI